MLLSALFQRYVPADKFAALFGEASEGFSALKIVLGIKRFLLYLAFVMAFSLVTGLIVNLVI